MGSSASNIQNDDEKVNDADVEADEKRMKALQALADNVESSIEGDRTMPNLMHNFSKMLQNPELTCFKDVVNTMKVNWGKVNKSLNTMPQNIQEEESNDIHRIQRDYWLLLLKTKSIIEILIKKCKIQQRHVRITSNILNNYKNGKFSNGDDAVAYAECLSSIAKWIDLQDLDSLFNEWSEICDRLKAKQLTWQKIAEDLKKHAKNVVSTSTAWKCVKYFGIIISLVAVVTIVVFAAAACTAATGGAAAPLVLSSGLGAVKTVAIGGTTIAATHAAGIAAGVGLLAVGGASWGAYGYWTRNNGAYKTYKNAMRITNMIQTLIKKSSGIEREIDALKTRKKEVSEEYNYLKDKKSRQLMQGSMNAIDEHLLEYIRQGQEVIAAVDKACVVYIK